METKGSFDLPTSNAQSTKGARNAYFAMWSREWPHDDSYLRTLAREAIEKGAPGKKCETLLWAMRENHEFETVN